MNNKAPKQDEDPFFMDDFPADDEQELLMMVDTKLNPLRSMIIRMICKKIVILI